MKRKRVVACLIVGTLVASMPMAVFAKNYQVSQEQGVQGIIDAIHDETNEDGTYTITLESGEYDFIGDGDVLYLEGKTYEINGTDITLTDVEIYGSGTITITADIKNKDNCEALNVGTDSGDLSVTVNGDVTADSVTDEEGNEISSGVNTWNDSFNNEEVGSGTTAVTVNGDVNSAGTGIRAGSSSEVTVSGDVESGSDAVNAWEDAEVTVEGDITSDGHGVYAIGDSTVTVKGNITAGDLENEDDWASGVRTDFTRDENGEIVDENSSNANVTVEGIVTASGDALVGNGTAKITVNGDVNSSHGTGAYALYNSGIEITGNVSGRTGVVTDYDYDENGKVEGTAPTSMVTVNGNITTTEDAVTGQGTAKITVNGDVNSSMAAGVYALEESNIEINGNVTGGTYDYGDGATGVIAEDDSSVTVVGNVTGGNGDGWGGKGIEINNEVDDSTATVTVIGDVKGGDATGKGGDGVTIGQSWVAGTSLTVVGNVTGGSTTGTGEDSESGYGLWYWQPELYYTSEDYGYDLSNYLFYQNEFPELRNIIDYIEMTAPENYEKAEELWVNYIEKKEAFFGEQGENGYIYNGTYGDIFSVISQRMSELDTSEMSEDELCDVYMQVVEEEFGDQYDEVLQAFASNYDNTVAALAELSPYYTDVNHIQVLLPNITVASLQSGIGLTSAYGANDESVQAYLDDEINYIALTSATNGTITLDKDSYKAGETIIITPTADNGYELSNVLVNGEALEAVDGVYSYVMPENGGVEISAEFTAVETPASPETPDPADQEPATTDPTDPGTTDTDDTDYDTPATTTPTTTNQTTTTPSTGNSQTSSPRTADTNMVGLWVALGGAAGVAALAAASKRKKKA